jgi:choline kinase
LVYIILAAGRGTRLQPLTLAYPKAMYKLDSSATLVHQMVSSIKSNDDKAEIVVVVGFQAESIINDLSDIDDINIVTNPFFDVTNSIASLWFVLKYLSKDCVTVLNSDLVFEDEVYKKIICHESDETSVLIDSSIKNDGDYNVEVDDDRVLVMSKNLATYYGEYAGVTKLAPADIEIFKAKLEEMIRNHMIDQWYENVLVQLIFEENFKLNYIDINEYKWTEVDSVDDLLLAKKIHNLNSNK